MDRQTLIEFAARDGESPRTRLFSARELRALGLSAAGLAEACSRGELTRVVRGRYALPEFDPRARFAARHAAALTCETALALRGCRTFGADRIHIRMRPGAPALGHRHIVPHRLPRAVAPASTPPVDSALDALHCALRCLPLERFAVVADSALESGLVDREDLERRGAMASRLDQRKLAAVDGRSQSVTETLVRVRLRRIGIAAVPQARLEGRERTDLRVGDRLNIECDSKAFHWAEEAYERDYRRGLRAFGRGEVTLRLTYRQVVEHWPEVEQTIVAFVRAREHLAGWGDAQLRRRSA